MTGKAIEVNAALRAAAGAVKMMSLSEGVECPYTLPEYKDKQCTIDEKTLWDLPAESAHDQFRRTLVFFRSIQQGVIPSIYQPALSKEEEEAFIKEWRNVSHRHKTEGAGIDLKQWIFTELLHVDPTINLSISLDHFLTGGTDTTPRPETMGRGVKGNPILIYGCKVRGDPTEIDVNRFIQSMEKDPKEMLYRLDAMDAPPKLITGAVIVDIKTTPRELRKIIINIVTDKVIAAAAKSGGVTAQFFGTDIIEATPIENTLYIRVNQKITTDYLVIYDINVQKRIFTDIFTAEAEIDIHPWLMYLLSKDSVVMNTAFGGNMTPQQYPLAFYIVAHFVANKPQYEKNPADFYRKPNADKKPEMLAAIKANESALDTLLRDGYAWLGEKYPGMGNIRQMLGDTTTALAGRRMAKAGESIKAGVRGVGASIASGLGRIGRMVTRSQSKQKGGTRRITRKALH